MEGVAVLQGPGGEPGDGPFYAVHTDQGMVGFSWASVTETLGLRATYPGR